MAAMVRKGGIVLIAPRLPHLRQRPDCLYLSRPRHGTLKPSCLAFLASAHFGPSPRIPLSWAWWLMKEFRYCISPDPCTPAVPTSELSVVMADSMSDAIELIKSNGYLKNDHAGQWLHVLVWTGDDGKERGFASSWL
jgi:hypothetical protein